jgi:hypothetical protein
MERVFLQGNGGVGRQSTEYRSQKDELPELLTLTTGVQEFRRGIGNSEDRSRKSRCGLALTLLITDH